MKISYSLFSFKPRSVLNLGLVIHMLACLCEGGDGAIEANSSCGADRFLLVSTSVTRDLNRYKV